MTAPTPDVEAAMERVAEMVADLKGDPAALAWPYKLTVPESLTCKAVVADLTLILAQAREAAGLREGLSAALTWLKAICEASDIDPEETVINVRAVDKATGVRGDPKATITLATSLAKLDALALTPAEKESA